MTDELAAATQTLSLSVAEEAGATCGSPVCGDHSSAPLSVELILAS